MNFETDNAVIRLCRQGMEMEVLGKNTEAARLFGQAWQEATNDFEKFTAAHYLARHQPGISEKLKWDQLALELALRVNNKASKDSLPSLYLNVGRGLEEGGQSLKALDHYKKGIKAAADLSDEGYGKMIRDVIQRAVDRLNVQKASG